MKTLRSILSEVAQPKAGDEINFKAKHEIEFWDHPESEEHQHTSRKRKAKRLADYDDHDDEVVYEAASKYKKGDTIVHKNRNGEHKAVIVDIDTYNATVKPVQGGAHYLVKKTDIKRKLNEAKNSLRFGVEKMPEKLVKDLGQLSNHVLGFELPNQGIRLSFDKAIPAKDLAKQLNAKIGSVKFDGLVDNNASSRSEYVYTIKESLDKVDQKALKKDFDDREDQDIDNDGDVDDSDEYLHKRRKAISRAMKKEDLSEKSLGTKTIDQIVSYMKSIEGKNVPAATVTASVNAIIKKLEEDLNETPFVAKAAYAKKKDKKKFEIGDKEYPVTIKDGAAKKITEAVGKETSILITDPTGASKDWSILKLSDPKWSPMNPNYLTTQIQKHAKTLGWKHGKMVAQWIGDLNTALAAAKKELSSGKKIQSVEVDLKKKIKDLELAKSIMSKHDEASLEESIELSETFKVGDKVTYQMNKRTRGNAVISSVSSAKKNHYYLKTEKEGTIMVPAGELELKESIELDEIFDKDYSGMLGKFKKAVENAEKNSNNSFKRKTHLENAKMRLMGMKSTDIAKLKSSDHYDRYKKMKSMKESIDLSENFKVGSMKLNDGSKVLLKKQDADLLNQMFDDLNSSNRKNMMKVAMTDKNGFEEILGFAREAL